MYLSGIVVQRRPVHHRSRAVAVDHILEMEDPLAALGDDLDRVAEIEQLLHLRFAPRREAANARSVAFLLNRAL